MADGHQLRLREKELAPVLAEYRKLSKAEREPELPNADEAVAARRKTPTPPKNGLVLRGYCTYMRPDKTGKFVRSKEFYYKENPDRWAAETQSDMLWLTEVEWRSLIPADAKLGNRQDVPDAIQKRFYCTIGIDYMEGSVNSLPARSSTMTLTVERITPETIHLRLDGYAQLGKAFDATNKGQDNTRGSEVRVLGHVTYDKTKNRLTRFDVVGIGKAWGTKRGDHRAIRVAEYPWTYGIAVELVTGDSPYDLIPPYNMLHYSSTGPYFGKK